MAIMRDKAPNTFRSIFLSDFHIGAKNFNAIALLDFLRTTESQTLYLVGDIIDGWKLNKRWYWTEDASQIFDELFRKAHEGTKIVYITGNHDETVRDISILKRLRYAARLNIQIKNRIIHRTMPHKKKTLPHPPARPMLGHERSLPATIIPSHTARQSLYHRGRFYMVGD